ncbi:MAG: hypothetical protein L0K67_09930, partial [Brevibacterium sp.]|nr:hypothetical protein [Brevibacterium sp.]
FTYILIGSVLATTTLLADSFVTSNEILAACAETAGTTTRARAARPETSARLMSFMKTPKERK